MEGGSAEKIYVLESLYGMITILEQMIRFKG